MNINKKKYCCLYISLNKSSFYFDIILEDKDLNEVLKVLKKDLKINFKISKYFIDKKYGILFMDNLELDKSNKLYICHFLNLLKFVKNNFNLVNSEKLLELYNNFILNNSINEK
jgi:hypothetical protein